MKKIAFIISPIFFLLACGEQSENSDQNDNDHVGTEEAVEEVLEIDINLNKISEIPSDCVFEGDEIDAYSWVDENGLNYFIRTIGELTTVAGEDDLSDPVSTQYLFAYHYTKENSKAEAKLLKETTDFIKDCEFDVLVSHEFDALTLTDIDDNGIGEITFIYRTACTSDVSPSTQKLIMLQNGDKFPLRGETKVMEVGGEFTVGEEFSNAPAGFQEHAEQLWSEHLVEYDFEL